jgi:hypothetical protein
MSKDTRSQDQRIEALEEALRDIANMPEHDQDDAHRLRYKAKQSLVTSKD